MIKWIALIVGAGLITFVVIRVIKVMLKTEKESKNNTTPDKPETIDDYKPQTPAMDINSSSASAPVVDFSAPTKTNGEAIHTDFADLFSDDFSNLTGTGFNDRIDDEFGDFSRHMHTRKGRRRKPVDFDLDGDMADSDFEYIPGSPDFSYLNKRQPKPKKTVERELNELPTELKVLMLSYIFDLKFFD